MGLLASPMVMQTREMQLQLLIRTLWFTTFSGTFRELVRCVTAGSEACLVTDRASRGLMRIYDHQTE